MIVCYDFHKVSDICLIIFVMRDNFLFPTREIIREETIVRVKDSEKNYCLEYLSTVREIV
jgi:hypothetical protein